MGSEYLPTKSPAEPVQTVESRKDIEPARPVMTAWIRTALEIAPPIRSRAYSVLQSYISFRYVIPFVAVCAAVYFYGIADRLYVSDAMVSIRNQGQSTSGIGAILSQGIFGSSATSSEDATLSEFILSREMLFALDRKLNLRRAYSSSSWNILARMRQNASTEDFLNFYRSTVTVTTRSDVGIVEVQVADPDAKRAQAIATGIVANSEAFMNRLSDRMRDATLRYAQLELQNSIAGVAVAQPAERDVAEARLRSAQQGLASLLGSTNQQQIFIMRISEPSLATEPTLPMRFIDVIGSVLVASGAYFILYLLWQNVRDHRKV